MADSMCVYIAHDQFQCFTVHVNKAKKKEGKASDKVRELHIPTLLPDLADSKIDP